MKQYIFDYLEDKYDLPGRIFDVTEFVDNYDCTIETTLWYTGGIKEINASLSAILGLTE